MQLVQRIPIDEARRHVGEGTALLVCAYDDEARFQAIPLEGGISMAEFHRREPTLDKAQELIFYCA